MHFTVTAEVENVVHGRGADDVKIFRLWNIVKLYCITVKCLNISMVNTLYKIDSNYLENIEFLSITKLTDLQNMNLISTSFYQYDDKIMSVKLKACVIFLFF